MELPHFKEHFVGPVANSARWEAITPRAGGIIVTTPAKCGTTWTQMLCALLVHGAPPLPEPLTRLSCWVDNIKEPIETVAARVNAQPWRRILKTHSPLASLVYREDAFYIVCGRDPRDAGLSHHDHMQNMINPIVDAATPNDFFALTMDALSQSRPAGIFLHIEAFWRYRALPNILFLHYADLSDDLESEMTRLAAFLGIDRPADERRALLPHASFAAMQENAASVAPQTHLHVWKKEEDFFRKARRGEWRDVLSAENQALYSAATRERFDHTMLDWLEGGRAAAGDPRFL